MFCRSVELWICFPLIYSLTQMFCVCLIRSDIQQLKNEFDYNTPFRSLSLSLSLALMPSLFLCCSIFLRLSRLWNGTRCNRTTNAFVRMLRIRLVLSAICWSNVGIHNAILHILPYRSSTIHYMYFDFAGLNKHQHWANAEQTK